ncbi:MAG: ABC transporter permease [Firmicutes bacterium]|nr:ABC transporter permease [Bacillota bacterium]
MSLRRQFLPLLGLAVVLLYVLAAILAPYLAPYPPDEVNLPMRLRPIGTPGHPLGTDHLGADLLSRVLFGARVSILVGVLAVSLSLAVGASLGAVAGYFGGWVDGVFSRFADLLMGFPYLLFTLFAMAILGPGIANLVLALSFKGWVEFFRLTRGEVMSEKTREYVLAARALGRSPAAIIAGEILPNIRHSLLVLATLRMGYLIVMEATLSFLGLGVPPDVPAWGSMVAAGREYMVSAWWIAMVPGLAVVGLVLSINLFGEGLREALDPRLRSL